MLWKGSQVTIARCRSHVTLALGVFAMVFALWAPNAHAQAQDLGAQGVTDVAAAAGVNGATDLPTIIGNILNIVFGIMGVLLLAYFLYAGYLWMTAGGNQEQVEKAKNYMKNAVIGLVIALSSFSIASFVLGWLGGDGLGSGIGDSGGTRGAIRPGSGFPSSAGALGDGVIEYHIPERDARAVPRNASIIITFKQPIDPVSLIANYTPQTSTTARDLNTNAVRIFQTGQEQASLLRGQDVEAMLSSDKQTLVLRPKVLLGNPTRASDYTVTLPGGNQGLRLFSEQGNGPSIFSAGEGGLNVQNVGYSWRFEVSTVVDNVPPRVVSVVPMANDRYAPNVVIQMNFDKPLNPLSAQGLVREGQGFQNVEVSASPLEGEGASRPNGVFTLSNRFQTIEFVTNVSCGVNSCGRQVYCLPFSSNIGVRIKAASLSPIPPQARVIQMENGLLFDGIVDYVGNSLDGNGDGQAQGPGAQPQFDDYSWRFQTTASPDLRAPSIEAVRPGIRASNVPVDEPITADFSHVLQMSTVTSESVRLRTNEPEELRDTFWWVVGGESILVNERPAKTRVSIGHRPFAPAQETAEGVVSPEYAPYLKSDIQNVLQNCFNPAASARCTGSPNCCDDTRSSSSCTIPQELRAVPRNP